MGTAGVRLRLLIVAAVVGVSAWAIYPPADRISLGLDLRGGMQLVLRVRTDEAVERQTRAAAEQVREQLAGAGRSAGRVEVGGITEFTVSEVEDNGLLRNATEGLDTQFERLTTGGRHVFRLRPAAAAVVRRETVEQAIETIERRVNDLGLAETVVARYSDDDKIMVQLPGVADVDEARRVIRSTAQLRLTLVEHGPVPTRAAALSAYGGTLPAGLEILPGRIEGPGPIAGGSADAAAPPVPPYYVVARAPAVTGADLRSVQPSLDEFNRPAVAFTLRPDAARRFGTFTAAHVNRLMATVIDDRVVSVATIISRIDDRGQIVGLSREEMQEQVITLRSGALPATLDYLDQRTVSATLGEASIRAGVLASLGGLALVTLFMLAYYRSQGLNAVVSIALNLLILLALMAVLEARVTLPGIAGLVLTIGMGVDSNVLIFERIREERAANGPRAAIRAAFDRVWITVVDTHVASLLAAAMLFQFGTSALRGFAVTLALGLLANVFTAVFVSRLLFDVMGRGERRAGSARGPAQSSGRAGGIPV